MKINYKNYLLVALVLLCNACSEVDFGDTNVDPNNPTENLPNALLARTLFVTGNASTAITPGLYIQHYADIQFTGGQRYGTTEFSYNEFYTVFINNLDRIISLNTDDDTKDQMTDFGTNGNQIAVAKLVKAFTYHTMTDRWGHVPFSQAIQPLDFPNPIFDSGETIYDGIFNLIDEALGQIDGGVGPTGDILFGGDMDRWRQFGNTLKLVMALRLSDASTDMGSPDYASTKFNEAVNNVISSVDDNMLFPYTSDDSTDNPWEDRYNDDRAPDNTVSKRFVDFLLDRNDPRISRYADEVPNAPGTYVGADETLTNPQIDRDDLSFITTNIANNSEAPGYIFTYAQVAFSKAEATLKGWISGNAEDFYYEGIKASMDQWGVAETEYDAYILEADVVWDDARAMELIAEQKWIAFFMQPYEAWAEWRRLDHPVLSPHPEALNGTNIPVRYGYASGLFDRNAAELENAISNQSLPAFDDLSTKLFWDKN